MLIDNKYKKWLDQHCGLLKKNTYKIADKIGQRDFVETFELSILKSVEIESISMQRAVETWERLGSLLTHHPLNKS